MKLPTLVIADPAQNVAASLSQHCERLASERHVVNTSEALLNYVREHGPDMAVVSMELVGPDTVDVIERVKKLAPKIFLVATYRELSVPTIEKLGRLQIGDILPQPVDITQLYRIASKHFDMPLRRHARHPITLEVTRVDGVLIGRTRDLSEGGLMMDAIHPLSANESILVNLALFEPDKPLRVRCQILQVDGQPPAPVTVRIQFEKLRGTEYERLLAFIDRVASAKNA